MAKASVHLQIQFQTSPSRLRGDNHHRLQWQATIILVRKEVDSSGPGGVVPVEVTQVVEPTTKSHAPVEVSSFQREREVDLRRICHVRDHPNTQLCPGCDGRGYRHMVRCQQIRVEIVFSASSSLRAVPGDVVMETASRRFPLADPPVVLRTSEETDAIRAVQRNRWKSTGQSSNHS